MTWTSTATAPLHERRPETEALAGRDYSTWTFEELRALAIQLRVPDAEHMTRHALIEVLGGPRPARITAGS